MSYSLSSLSAAGFAGHHLGHSAFKHQHQVFLPAQRVEPHLHVRAHLVPLLVEFHLIKLRLLDGSLVAGSVTFNVSITGS